MTHAKHQPLDTYGIVTQRLVQRETFRVLTLRWRLHRKPAGASLGSQVSNNGTVGSLTGCIFGSDTFFRFRPRLVASFPRSGSHARHVLSYGTRQPRWQQDKGDANVHARWMSMVCINVLIMEVLPGWRHTAVMYEVYNCRGGCWVPLVTVHKGITKLKCTNTFHFTLITSMAPLILYTRSWLHFVSGREPFIHSHHWKQTKDYREIVRKKTLLLLDFRKTVSIHMKVSSWIREETRRNTFKDVCAHVLGRKTKKKIDITSKRSETEDTWKLMTDWLKLRCGGDDIRVLIPPYSSHSLCII